MKTAIIVDAGPLVAYFDRNVPMSLADASLVRLSKLCEQSQIFTLDSDFAIYRRFDAVQFRC